MTPIVNHIRHNLIAGVALFIALRGTSYAVSALPPNSVGGPQLKNRAIDPVKFDPGYINGSVAAWAIVGATGKLIAGGGKPRLVRTPIVANYQIDSGVKFKPTCSATSTIDNSRSRPTEVIPLPNSNGSTAPFIADYAVSSNEPDRGPSATSVVTFSQAGQLTPLAFNTAVAARTWGPQTR
jgi:hypothetical protein